MVVESKDVQLPRALSVKELADTLNVSAVEIIKELMKNGVMASINQVIDYDTAAIVASDFGFEPRQQNEFAFHAFGTGAATSYAWDFDDGTTATTAVPDVVHAYADAKPHVVTLTVPGTNCHVQHTVVTPRRRAAGH